MVMSSTSHSLFVDRGLMTPMSPISRSGSVERNHSGFLRSTAGQIRRSSLRIRKVSTDMLPQIYTSVTVPRIYSGSSNLISGAQLGPTASVVTGNCKEYCGSVTGSRSSRIQSAPSDLSLSVTPNTHLKRRFLDLYQVRSALNYIIFYILVLGDDINKFNRYIYL